MGVNAANMKKAAGAGYATATDLADWLVRALNVPFREAHHITGRAVALYRARLRATPRPRASGRMPLARRYSCRCS